MAKKLFNTTAVLFCSILFLQSCTIVKPGETGVKRKLGKLSNTSYDPGVRFYNPFLSKILRVPIRTVNREVKLPLPSREGLTIQSEISILYRIDKKAAPGVIRNIGMNYEEVVILP
ncbi:MAG: prohibitin family protein, partial [Sphingomonadales bacterium]|nr:prohibitin family protein [Sphingomonadales bacterium]